jgi:hypothetical protein
MGVVIGLFFAGFLLGGAAGVFAMALISAKRQRETQQES